MPSKAKFTLNDALKHVPPYFWKIKERIPANTLSPKERIQLVRHLKVSGVTLDQMALITGYNRKTLVYWVNYYWDGDLKMSQAVLNVYANRLKGSIKNAQKQLNQLLELLDTPMSFKEAQSKIEKLQLCEKELGKPLGELNLEKFEKYYSNYLMPKDKKKYLATKIESDEKSLIDKFTWET